MRRITTHKPGDLVTFYHMTTGEGLGRVVSVNCVTADIQPVDIDDNYRECESGAVLSKLLTALCRVPDRQEILERGQTIRDTDLARRASHTDIRHTWVPSIREYASTLFHG